MKKLLSCVLLIIALSVFIFSSFDALTEWAGVHKNESKEWWGSDKFRYGDLYGMSYLSAFRDENPWGTTSINNADSSASGRNTVLYALGDSFTWGIIDKPSLFYNVKELHYVRSNNFDVMDATLDTSKKNIILIECIERNVRNLFKDTAYLKKFLQMGNQQVNATVSKPSLLAKFKLKNVDANIEYNIWDYRIFTRIKEWKADLNFKLFNRTNSDVKIGPDHKYLLYSPNVDTGYNTSSFKSLYQDEVDEIVHCLNVVNDFYLSKGFDAVYISIVPNPVSILYPKYNGLTYNNVILRIQQHKQLKIKVTDIYGTFVKSKEQLYSYSDTHWTLTGKKIWIDLFNTQLKAD